MEVKILGLKIWMEVTTRSWDRNAFEEIATATSGLWLSFRVNVATEGWYG